MQKKKGIFLAETEGKKEEATGAGQCEQSASGQEQKRIPSRGTSRSKDVTVEACGACGGVSGSVPPEGPAGGVGCVW